MTRPVVPAIALLRRVGKQSGVAMLEVLVAILVLSVGMLGMLGLMLNGMKLTTTSTFRSIATQEAIVMVEIFRASVPALEHYDNPTVSTTNSCLATAGCLQPNMAGTELALWKNQLAAVLPAGDGTVCRSATLSGDPNAWNCTAGAGDPWVIKVCWDETQVGIKSGVAPGHQYYECLYSRVSGVMHVS
jgi:type IV pilus assembly protein PilV